MKKILTIAGIITVVGVGYYAYNTYSSYNQAKEVMTEMAFDACIENPLATPDFCLKSSECAGEKGAKFALKNSLSIRETINSDEFSGFVFQCVQESIKSLWR